MRTRRKAMTGNKGRCQSVLRRVGNAPHALKVCTSPLPLDHTSPLPTADTAASWREAAQPPQAHRCAAGCCRRQRRFQEVCGKAKPRILGGFASTSLSVKHLDYITLRFLFRAYDYFVPTAIRTWSASRLRRHNEAAHCHTLRHTDRRPAASCGCSA